MHRIVETLQTIRDAPRRFTFAVFYEITKNEIMVLAVGDLRADPFTLRKLLGDRFGHRSIDVAGVFCGYCLDEHDPTFFVRDRVVHGAFRDDVHVAGVQFYLFTFELDQQPSADDQKEFVLVFVVVPRQFPSNFCDLHVLIVYTAYHFRGPVIANLIKALLNIYFHR